MKYLINKFCAVILLITITSCKKEWLNEKANQSQVIPATLADFQAIMNDESLNTLVGSPLSLLEISSDGHYTSEAAWASGRDANAFNAYTWSQKELYSIIQWQSVYKVVFTANIVLDALQMYGPVNQEEQEIWNDIKGQALFHRAINFYDAAQLWAPPYDVSNASTTLSIPLRLEADVTIPSQRSTVEQTYRQIINDLQISKDLLSPAFVTTTRPYKLAAFALLARVYLSMREYKKAGEYADSCLKAYSLLMNYDSLSLTANYIGSPLTNPEVIFHKAFPSFSLNNFLSTASFIDKELYNSYDSNDLRKVIFFRINADSTIRYKGTYNNSTLFLFCGLSTDELYLIRAESYARSGETTLAMKSFNDLLRTRWRKINGASTYIDQTASSAEDALVKILNERKKELLMRGLRWADLRRLNFEDNFKTTLQRTIGGNTYILEPGSFRYTFPIPGEALSRSNLQQNPGW